MKSLRWIMMALAGYAVFSLVQRYFGAGAGAASPMQRWHSAPNPPEHNPLTGPGQGELTSTADASGASVPHRVGRGVVTR